MGADIHLYVEYINKERKASDIAKGKKPYWYCFGSKFNLGRDYTMFGLLAGVRSDKEGVFPRKGIPDDVGYYAETDNQLYITETGSGNENVSITNAESWVKQRLSRYVKNSEGKDTWVTHPDWHSHSWLTYDEFALVLKKYRSKEGYSAIEYRAVLAAMKTLQSTDKKNEVRIVFWFDN